MANIKLLLNLGYASRCAHNYPELRSNIQVPHNFGLFSEKKLDAFLAVPFKKFLHREGFFNSVQILQQNVARARIVFRTNTPSGDDIVVKWCNTEAPGCFNFSGSMKMELYMHGVLASEMGTLIPECIRYGSDFIAIRYIAGESFSALMEGGREDELIAALETLLDHLEKLYIKTKKNTLSVQQFNLLVHRDYQYQTQAYKTKLSEILLASIYAPRTAQERYAYFSNKAFEVFMSRSDPWPSCMTIRDLDERNLRIQLPTRRVYAVDMEDSCVANMLFDLAFLSARVVMAAKPSEVFQRLIPLIKRLIISVDKTDPNSSIALYKNLLAMQLTIALINPRMWPVPVIAESKVAFRPLMERARWLKDGWSIVDRLSS